MQNKVYRLRLELRDARGMKIHNAADLRRAGAEKAIMREVLVPGKMMLLELHYLIQRLFGWENIHLHRFSLREPDFNWVTEGNPDTYLRFNGVLFRITETSGFEWKWHNKIWKTPPAGLAGEKGSGSIEDSFIFNRVKASLSATAGRRLKSFRAYPEASGFGSMRRGFNVLLDRLRVGQVFTLREEGVYINVDCEERARWKAKMEDNVRDCAEELARFARDEPEAYRSAMRALKDYQMLKEDYLALLECGEEDLSGEFAALIREHEDKLMEYARGARTLTFKFCPGVIPAFGRILYWYDSGDEWCVSVSCAGIFIGNGKEKCGRDEEGETLGGTSPGEMPCAEDGDVKGGTLGEAPGAAPDAEDGDASGDKGVEAYGEASGDKGAGMPGNAGGRKPAHSGIGISGINAHSDDRISEAVKRVADTGEPECIGREGYKLMENVGGVKGYFRLLKALTGEEREETRALREMAAIYGWREE